MCFGRPVSGQDTSKSSRQFRMGLAPPPNLPPDSVKINGNWIYNTYDEPPTPPGGKKGYLQYLKKNIKFSEPRDSACNGTVYVSIIVLKDGSLTNVHIEKDEIGRRCGEEAVRVIKSMPPWKPAKRNGKPINMNYVIPVKFVLP